MTIYMLSLYYTKDKSNELIAITKIFNISNNLNEYPYFFHNLRNKI